MRHIIGSIIEGEKIHPFIFNAENGDLNLKEYSWNKCDTFNASEEVELKNKIQSLIPFKADEIKIGEYYCLDCHKWFEAAGDKWSYGICLSCSLDQGTEMANWEDDDDV